MAAESRRSSSVVRGGILLLVGVAFFLGWWLRGVGDDDSSRGTPPPSYTANIGITHGYDGAFAEFLAENQGQVVYLSAMIDLSVSLGAQQEIADQFQVHRFLDDPTTPLPLAPDGSTMLVFELVDRRMLPSSHGGTGIVQIVCTGYFRVSHTLRAGPSLTYHLREIAEVVSIAGDSL